MTPKPALSERRRVIAALIDALCALVVAALCSGAAWHGLGIYLLGLWMLAWGWHGANRGYVSPLILGATGGAALVALLTSPGAVIVRPVNAAIVGALVAGVGAELYRHNRSRKSAPRPGDSPVVEPPAPTAPGPTDPPGPPP